jgi:hypothetical protein
MNNRVFFPQVALDVWLSDGTVDLHGNELSIVAEERRYRLTESVRIVNEVTGSADAHDLVGRVKTKAALQEKGAELLETSMLLGENAYDVVPGWLGDPVGTFEEHIVKRSMLPAPAPHNPSSDEDLLATYLVKHL